MAVAVLPMLQVGGMQLFRIEAFDADKVLPRAAQIAGGIGIVYVFLTSVGALVLWSLGMSGFDAISHAMTSIATGGFSNYDASIAHFDNAGIEWAMSVIMRSEEHTSELQSLMRISYAVFCLKKKNKH